jgi:hypothetical protein
MSTAACGGGGSGSDVLGPDPVARAARATLQKGSSRVDLVMKIKPADAPRELTVKANGVTNAKLTATALTFDFADVLSETDYEGPTKGEQISKGLVLYWNFPFFQGELPSGKKWVKLDLAKAAKKYWGATSQEIAQMAGGEDPQQTLRDLRASNGQVKKVGEDEVHGVVTMHYRATISIDKAMANLPKKQRALIRRFYRRSGKSFEAEVWVDKDGLIRREREDVPEGWVMVTYYDFGLQLNIQPPPADETVDIFELIREENSG